MGGPGGFGPDPFGGPMGGPVVLAQVVQEVLVPGGPGGFGPGGPGGFGPMDQFGNEPVFEPVMNYFFDDPHFIQVSLRRNFLNMKLRNMDLVVGLVVVQEVVRVILLLVPVIMIHKINLQKLMHGDLMVLVVVMFLKGGLEMMFFLVD